MPTVYVTHDDGAKNLSPALKFGELKSVVTRNWPLYGDSGDHKRKIEETLDDFNFDTDWLLLVGDPLNIAWAVSHLYIILTGNNKFETPIPCLKWDRQEKMYIAVKL